MSLGTRSELEYAITHSAALGHVDKIPIKYQTIIQSACTALSGALEMSVPASALATKPIDKNHVPLVVCVHELLTHQLRDKTARGECVIASGTLISYIYTYKKSRDASDEIAPNNVV